MKYDKLAVNIETVLGFTVRFFESEKGKQTVAVGGLLTVVFSCCVYL